MRFECRLGAPSAVGDRAGHRGHLQSRGLSLALSDRGGADIQFALDLSGRGEAAFNRAVHTRWVVEAEVFRGPHQARRPDLDAERSEHRVARDRESERQAASARLAIGVFELYAI